MQTKRSSMAVLFALAFAAGCGSGGGSSLPTAVPGRAALSIAVIPNPIQAKRVSGDTYDFPFTVSLRESNGVSVEVQNVRADVRALGGIPIYSESYGPAEIARLGYPTTIPANGDLRYSLSPRKEVPDDRLFGSVSAEVTVEGRDANGNQVSASTTVTVTR
jgi:hypothetical protein